MLKKTSKFGIGKFLVTALVLGGGLIYGTQMVQKNQENRSSAAAPVMICKCSNPKYGNAYNCAKYKGKWSCTPIAAPTTKPTSKPTSKPSSGQKYYFYNGSKCVSTGDSYTSVSVCKGSVGSVCYSSLSGCQNANSSKLIQNNCASYGSSQCGTVSGCRWDSANYVCKSSNVVVNPCKPGEQRCGGDGSYVENCNSDGTTWEYKYVCEAGCNNGKCNSYSLGGSGSSDGN